MADTDELGREILPVDQQKRGPKEKPWSKRHVFSFRMNSALRTKLYRLSKSAGKDEGDYLRDLIDDDWDRKSHLIH